MFGMNAANDQAAVTLPGTTGLLFTLYVEGLLANPFFNRVYSGIATAASDLNRNVLGFFGTCMHADRVRECVLDSPAIGAVDSLIAIELFDESVLGDAAKLRPLACVDADVRIPGVSSICFDHEASVRMAFEHLLSLGHRRIGFVGEKASSDPAVAARLDSFRDALAELDEPHKERLLFLPDSKSLAGDMVKQWLGQPADLRPTALVVIDNTFWGFLFAMMAAGTKVPADLSLVSVGVLRTWADQANHFMRMRGRDRERWEQVLPLPEHFSNEPAALAALRPTTVHLPAIEMGRWAQEELARRVADPSSEPRYECLGPTLIEGNTTAPISA